MPNAIVLLSGGQDSTTSLFWAKQKFESIDAIGFDYGQKHRIELEQAKTIAHIAGVKFRIVNITGILTGSALIEHELDVNAAHPRDASLPSTFVPGRNLLFLSIAGSYAYTLGIQDIVVGVCQTDYSGYPDCRREFIEALQSTMSLAMAPHTFQIHTPIMDLDKADTFKLAADLGVLEIVLEHSHTDYNGDRSVRNPWGYGRLDNEASRLRAKGWLEFCRRYPQLAPKS